MPSFHDLKSISLKGSDAECYRCQRCFLYIGLFGTVFFLTIGIVSSTEAYLDINTSFPKTVAILLALFWSCWAYFGVLAILQYVRSRLFVSETHVESIGVLKRSIIALDELTQIKWRVFPSRSIVLLTTNGKVVIDLENYSTKQQVTLIKFFRKNINHKIQNGWGRFFRFYRLILKRSETRPSFTRSFYIVITVSLFCFGLLFICIWMAGYYKMYLYTGIVNLIVALLFLCMAIKKRKPESTNPNLC